ncbi:MAG TPA: PrsW family intramembrane metalloprotease [Thermoplasmata archaeon]|nr:PrsW family intramembrane metalloprotease [Thermoplasmata archaeon]
MSAVNAASSLALLVLISLVPALIYLLWVRRAERFQGEAWGTVLSAFAYGALFATLTAAVVEAVIVGLGNSVSQHYPGPEFVFLNSGSPAGTFFLVLVVAPFVEEGLKGSGVFYFRSRFRQIADGPVLGASVGLGFGFFETFLYGLGAYLTGGLVAGIVLILVRSVSSVVLHGSSTGMFGYGIARSAYKQPGPGSGSYYLLAVAMHAGFNALASLTVILALAGIGGFAANAAALLALVAAIAFAFGAIEHVRTVIQLADYPSITGGLRYKPPPPPTRAALTPKS